MENKSSLANVATDDLHLYLAWGCPFCHRVTAALATTSLTDKVSITWMKNIKGEPGWEIEPTDDPLFNASSLAEVYKQLLPNEQTRFSVPLLVDKNLKSFMSSSSVDIVRLISSGFNGRYPVNENLAPEYLQKEIDSLNSWIHERVNRAVYLVGFSTDQQEYEEKVVSLFAALDTLEERLSKQPYLFGNSITESDLFLLATLERFDSIYFILFKCTLKRISDYEVLSNYMNRLTSNETLSKTYNDRLAREHYFLSTMHVRGEVRELNPSKLIPITSQT